MITLFYMIMTPVLYTGSVHRFCTQVLYTVYINYQ